MALRRGELIDLFAVARLVPLQFADGCQNSLPGGFAGCIALRNHIIDTTGRGQLGAVAVFPDHESLVFVCIQSMYVADKRSPR